MRKSSYLHVSIGLAFGLALISCNSTWRPSHLNHTSEASLPRSPKLVWLSLDALNQANLSPYLDKITSPHPRGLKWLLGRDQKSRLLSVSYPSITASSHISTMTCAPAGVHGVFMNSGNWNGERDLNGFAMPYKTETWVQALRKDKKQVAVAAYPSIDGSTPERSADLGIAYDIPAGKVQYVTLGAAGDGTATVVSHQTPGKSYAFKFRLNQDQTVTAESDFGETVQLKAGQATESFGIDGLDEARRQASVSMLHLGKQSATSATVVAVSPVSVTPVVGDALKTILDENRIVWSNLRDYGYAKFDHGVAMGLESLRHRRSIELRAIKEMIALGTSDAMFLYFEDIDVILHAWMGLPHLEDQIAAYLTEFDHDLGELLTSFPGDTNLVVMGDHGMSAIQYELNVRALLPAGVASQVQLRTSGGTMVLYPAGRLDSNPPAGMSLEVVAQVLREATVEFDGNRKVFNRVVVRGTDEAKALGVSGNQSPWILAFANEGIAVVDRLSSPLLVSRRETFEIPEAFKTKYPDPMDRGQLLQPTILGAHGHDSSLASMQTHLVLLGPEVSRIDLSKVESNLQVVPHIAQALGWVKPEACR